MRGTAPALRRGRTEEKPAPTPETFYHTICRHQLRVVSHNFTMGYNETLKSMLNFYQDYDVICLQGTRFHKKKTPYAGRCKVDTNTPMRTEYISACKRFWIISWGWGNGTGTNHMAGVAICLNVRTMPRELIQLRHDPDYEFAGRYGAVTLKYEE